MPPQTVKPYRWSWFDQVCLWYPPGWLILFNRHWQHYRADPGGWSWLEYPWFLVPGGFYLALALRWLRLRGRLPPVGDAVPDPSYQAAFHRDILTPIADRHFQAELHQVEFLPDTLPLLITMNHAGMCFPWDFMMLGWLLKQTKGWFVQPLAHPVFFEHPWLRWWLPAGWAYVLGGVRADRSSFAAALTQPPVTSSQPAVVLYAPEGWRGIAKGWHQRYHLKTFDPSFVRLSWRHQVPIAPVVCWGNEWLHPWTVNLQSLARRLGLPMLPLSPLMPLFLLFPSMGVWAVRTRLRYYIQPLWTPWTETDPPSPHPADRLRAWLQAELDRLRGNGSD